ncbi:hypothetical protein Tco_1505839 [Tanacetum coccineum]
MSDKESLEEEITAEVQPVNVNEEEEESTEDDYELRRRDKGKEVEKIRNTPIPTPTRSPRIHSTLISSDTEKLQELTESDPKPSSSTPSSSLSNPNYLLQTASYHCLIPRLDTSNDTRASLMNCKDSTIICLSISRQEISSQSNDAITNHIPSQVDSSVKNYISGHILHVHPTQATLTSAQEQQHQLFLMMRDKHRLQQDDLLIWLALKYKFEILNVSNTPCRPSAVRHRDQEDPYDDAHPDGGEYPSTSGNQEQVDDFDFWTNSYATDDDELPIEKVSQELIEEMS